MPNPAGFLYNFARRVIPDSRNYRFLEQAAGDILSRSIPKNVNWGGLPTQFLNKLDDIYRMVPGATKEAARSNVKRDLVRAAAQPPARPTGQFGLGGILRAPVIGTPSVRPPGVTIPPSSALPGGGPFNIDYALRRATGFTGSPQQIAAKLGAFPLDNPLVRAGATARYLTRQAGNIPGNIVAAGSALFRPSTALASIPGLNNPLVQFGLGIPTGLAGTMYAVSQLQGDTPQSADPYANWQRLGYGSREDMFQRVNRQAQLNQPGGAIYGPPLRYNTPPLTPPRDNLGIGNPPPGLPLSPPSDFSGGGGQAGQQPPLGAPPQAPGVVSNGAGVPAQRQDVINRSLSQEVLNAAQQYAAPTGIPLSSFYEGQQQLGRSMMNKGTLTSELQALGVGAGMTEQDLQTWIRQNPGLAYRELVRRKGM